jgi:hypothetical protein
MSKLSQTFAIVVLTLQKIVSSVLHGDAEGTHG